VISTSWSDAALSAALSAGSELAAEAASKPIAAHAAIRMAFRPGLFLGRHPSIAERPTDFEFLLVIFQPPYLSTLDVIVLCNLLFVLRTIQPYDMVAHSAHGQRFVTRSLENGQ